MSDNQLLVLDDDSLIQIVPIVKDSTDAIVGKGQPTTVTLGELITFLQTKTGWTA